MFERRFARGAGTVLLLSLLTIMPGCKTTTPVQDYRASPENLSTLLQYRLRGGNIRLTEFTDSADTGQIDWSVLRCSPTDRGDDRQIPYARYIEDAIRSELRLAGMDQDRPSSLGLAGTLKQVSLKRRWPFGARWSLAMEIVGSDGTRTDVAYDHDFDTGALLGPTVCREITRAWDNAVHNLVETLFRSASFRQAIGAGTGPDQPENS